MSDDYFGPPIHTYTRAQAIEDGSLVDVTKTAREAGFTLNTCVTTGVWGLIVPAEGFARETGVSTEGRLWDVLWMASLAARRKRNAGASEVRFEVILPQSKHDAANHTCEFKLHIGPGDQGEPVLTVMLPNED